MVAWHRESTKLITIMVGIISYWFVKLKSLSVFQCLTYLRKANNEWDFEFNNLPSASIVLLQETQFIEVFIQMSSYSDISHLDYHFTISTFIYP